MKLHSLWRPMLWAMIAFCVAGGALTAPTATSYYVSPSGRDSNPGTLAQPWRTIQHAVNSVSAGDTIFVRKGTYRERVLVSRSGTANAFITIAVYPGEVATVDGQGIDLPYDWGGLIDLSNQNYVRVTGLRVINSDYAGIFGEYGGNIVVDHTYTYNTSSSGIAFFWTHDVQVKYNEVVWAGTGDEQENVTIAGVQNFEVSYNHIHGYNPATGGKHGIDAKAGATNGSIHHNIIHDLYNSGIYIDAYDRHTSNIRIYANRIYNIAADGINIASEAGGVLDTIWINNNLVYNNQYMGLRFSECCSNLADEHPVTAIRVFNNTFYNNGWGEWGGGIWMLNPDLTQVVIRNNIISQNSAFQILADSGVSLATITIDRNLIDGYRGREGELYGEDYVEGDPLFFSPASYNLHLKPGSPAIDRGKTKGDVPPFDILGISRPQDGDRDGTPAYDLGAYEVFVPDSRIYLPIVRR